MLPDLIVSLPHTFRCSSLHSDRRAFSFSHSIVRHRFVAPVLRNKIFAFSSPSLFILHPTNRSILLFQHSYRSHSLPFACSDFEQPAPQSAADDELRRLIDVSSDCGRSPRHVLAGADIEGTTQEARRPNRRNPSQQ